VKARVLAAAAGATVLAVALTGCGSKAKAADAKPTAHPPTTSAAPSPQDTPPEATYAPGDTVMSTDDLTAACDEGFGGTTATDPTSPDLSTDSTDSSSSFGDGSADTTSNAEAKILQVRHSGIVLVQCTMSPDAKLVALDARAHQVLWNIDLAQGGDYSDDTDGVLQGDGSRVYLLTVTDHPADGLQAEYFTRTVTALDEQTGAQSWTQPLEPNDKESNNTEGTVE
jgi:outer membrane protein assembly factor BamB